MARRRLASSLLYLPGTSFDFLKSNLGAWFSPLPSIRLMTVPQEDSRNRSVSGIRRAKDQWVAEMASSLPGSS